jgi:hypothetical protein
MKIYVLGSNSFVKEMVGAKDELRKLGYDGWIHPEYILIANGQGDKEKLHREENGEHAAVKRENNYLKVHYKHILESDAILIVNLEKKGLKNYIGGNVLIEMGQAHVNDKKIFFSHGMPTESAYLDEIQAMDPICLHGDLKNIAQYVK